MDMLTIFIAFLGLLVGLGIGGSLGRGYERYRIYENLLRSKDPQSWTAAHRVEVGDRARYPSDESSGSYLPAPRMGKAPPELLPHDFPFPSEKDALALAPTVMSKPVRTGRWTVPKPPPC